MIIQSNVKRIITEVGKQFNLTPQEASEHYILYIQEYILKNLYEADFDILRIEALGTIAVGLIRAKSYYYKMIERETSNPETLRKVKHQIDLMDELNKTLKRKRLYG